jgi:hypothetical protein
MIYSPLLLVVLRGWRWNVFTGTVMHCLKCGPLPRLGDASG